MIDKLVRDLRMKKGYSSRFLAQKVGRNSTWVSQIETGRIKHPYLPSFKQMLKYLGVSEEDIEQIILTYFKSADTVSNKTRSTNKVDYRLERKYLMSKNKAYKDIKTVEVNEEEKQEEIQQPKQMIKTEKYFTSNVLTKEEYKQKCKDDALQLFEEIKVLPNDTLEILVSYLIDEL